MEKRRKKISLGLGLVASLCFYLAPPVVADTPAPASLKLSIPFTVLPLAGHLDDVLVVNSNSPEIVQTEGILVSTLAPNGQAVANGQAVPNGQATPAFPAHLDCPLNGRFDIFFHHIANQTLSQDKRTLYLAVLLRNPGNKPAHVHLLQAASYLSQPDAPFIAMDDWIENKEGSLFAGPGDRAVDDVLRGKRQKGWLKHGQESLRLAPLATKILLCAPVPCLQLSPPVNGRSGLARLRTNRPVQAAVLALYGKANAAGQETAPTLEDCLRLLQSNVLAGPRESAASLPDSGAPIKYGRVAGVSRGSSWKGTVTNDDGADWFNLTKGSAYAFPIASVREGMLGTGQVQSAPLAVRYPDTAYAAHGNYGVEYDITLPLRNPTDTSIDASLSLDTPLKEANLPDQLQFYDPPADHIFFRGTVEALWHQGKHKMRRYIHLVERQGQMSRHPLFTVTIAPHKTSVARVRLIYPPDATPPQALTIRSLQGGDM